MNEADAKVDDILHDFAERSRMRLAEEAGYLTGGAESPIERIFGIALLSALSEIREFSFDIRCSGDPAPEPDGSNNFIVPQAVFNNGRYRVDFFVQAGPSKKPTKIAIECDGHDFHERTKEQAARDRQRDRWFQTKGIVILRFTGSEIWRDPMACAEQVVEIVINRVFFS